MSLCILILSVANLMLIVLTIPQFMNIGRPLHEMTGNRPCFSPQHMYRYSNLCSLFPQDLEFYAATVEFESSPVFSKIWRGDFSNTVVVFSSPLLESDARH